MFIILVSVPLLYGADIPIMPRADFTLNFCNYPLAWTVSQGDGVSVGVVYNKKENSPNWEEWVTSGAPKTKTFRITPESFLDVKSKLLTPQILLLMEETPKKAFSKTVTAIKSFSEKGVIVIMPAYFGPMNKDRDYSAWRGFVSDAHLAGAVVVGVHGKQYELGHLS
ncbi:MAG: hypothetical protein GY757_12650, partial [bacterium]|nr:hypothetical protein [bacterium]